jgi:YidC/Oxa1 family membrane protein insertase
MENQRLLLWVAFTAVLYLLYQAWVTDTHPAVPASEPAAIESPTPAPSALPALPTAPTSAAAAATPAPAPPAAQHGERIHVRTDVLDLDIDTLGASLVRADLLRYPVHKGEADLVRLLDPTPATMFVLRSGMRSANGGPEPTHEVVYKADASEYVLGPEQNTLAVTLTWEERGLIARTTYTFTRGSYAIQLHREITNGTGSAWSGASYIQLQRRHVPLKRSRTSIDAYSFIGPVFDNGHKYQRFKIEDLAKTPLNETVRGGWLASIQHHFVGAVVPDPTHTTAYSSNVQGDVYTLTAIDAEPLNVDNGQTATSDDALFVGPKLQKQLKATADRLDLTVDYVAMLTLIARPLFVLLSWLHSLTGNWGWAIVLVTVIIKVVFYKLSAASGRSMAKMRKLQPRMKALQERYADDRQELSRKMMDLYKSEGANPMAGCLPILVQMPVFFALYWVLIESVEMRQAPFVLWINDLSSRDPYFILPLLMGVTMFAQQKLNPAPPDPVQAKVMMLMPVIFTGLFAFFPAGLVLYWFVNNLLSILPQWRINTVVEREGHRVKGTHKNASER